MTVVPPNALSIDAIKDLSPRDLYWRFADKEDEESTVFLCEAICAEYLDPEIRAYCAHLSVAQQAKLMDLLIERYNQQTTEVAEQIVNACTGAVFGYWTGFAPFALLLFQRRSYAATLSIVERISSRRRVALALLQTMKERTSFIAQWLQTIGARIASGDFESDDADEVQPELDKLYAYCQEALAMRSRDCDACGGLAERADNVEYHFNESSPADVDVLSTLRDEDYRDEAGDLCHIRVQLCQCRACGQLFAHSADADMQVMGWSVVVIWEPISEKDAELRRKRGR